MTEDDTAAMKVALCQLLSEPGSVERNAKLVIDALNSENADLFIFPEMFLTDYSFKDFDSVKEKVSEALNVILEVTKKKGCTAVVGGPRYVDDGVMNTAYILSDKVTWYDKINLPNFGVFSERSIFRNGSEPKIFECKGFRFGVIVCYDIFFPELTKMYAMNGADAVVCISASPMTSRVAFERVIPARSVESTVYMLFVNNIGMRGKMEFFGKSRCLTPTGDISVIMDHDSGIRTVELTKDDIEFARSQRPTIADTKVWMSNRTR